MAEVEVESVAEEVEEEVVPPVVDVLPVVDVHPVAVGSPSSTEGS